MNSENTLNLWSLDQALLLFLSIANVCICMQTQTLSKGNHKLLIYEGNMKLLGWLYETMDSYFTVARTETIKSSVVMKTPRGLPMQGFCYTPLNSLHLVLLI